MAMTLAVYKSLLDRHNKLMEGTFEHTKENRILKGSTCAILGFGGIGRASARLLRCFGARILAINTSGNTDEEVEFVGTLKDLEYVLRLGDVIIVAFPLTNSTRGLLARRELGWMKDNATLVNVARAEIIDEAALFERLKAHPSFNAAIDVWWTEPAENEQFRSNYPFLTLPNVIGSPHNSGSVPAALVNAVGYAAENVKRYYNNERILGVVNRNDYT
jgi:phosphoglycerate dehydrogenase-like enzyme